MSKEDTKLKPCPFCGSTASVWGIGSFLFFGVECDNEECGCTYGDNMRLSYEEAIEMWNKRAESEEDNTMEWIPIHPLQNNDGGAYACSKCHSGDYGCENDKFCRWCGRKAVSE